MCISEDGNILRRVKDDKIESGYVVMKGSESFSSVYRNSGFNTTLEPLKYELDK
jgi:hypothetical protein